MTGTGKPLTGESLIIVAFSIILLLYSLIIGQLLWGLTGIILLRVLLRFIHAGANNPINNQFLWIILIIIMAYSLITGQLLWGLIAVLQIAILWILIYRLSKKVKEKYYDYSKRPTGVTVLAVLYAFNVFFEILGLITGRPALYFGVTLSGVSAQLVYVISILTGIYLTYGFIKLLKLAWIIAIIFWFYELLNTLIRIISHGSYMSFGIIGAMFIPLLNIIIIAYILGKADYFKN